VVVSPDELNRHIATVIVAPLTTGIRPYPTRVTSSFQGKTGQVALDQIRSVDQVRLIRRLGRLDRSAQVVILRALAELFAE
jgi:mRNA interferase MazF